MTKISKSARYALVALICLVVGTTAGLRASATSAPVKDPIAVAYVDAAFLVRLHPSMAAVDELRARAESELSEVEAQLAQLDARARQGEALMAEEQELFQALLTTRNELFTRYQSQIDTAVEPAFTAVGAAVDEVAERFSVSFIFDINVGTEAGFVVYADPAIDLTSVVAEVMDLD